MGVHGLRNLVNDLVSGGLSRTRDDESLHRARMVNVMGAAAAAFFFTFSVLHLLAGRYVSGLTQSAAGAALLGVLVYLRVTKDIRTAALLTCGSAFVASLVRLHYAPPAGYGFLWSFMMPLLAVFTLGHRSGLVMTLAYGAAAALALYWPDNPFMHGTLEPAFRFRLLATLLGILVGAYVVEWARTHAHAALHASEHRFRSLIENGASVYAIVAADGTILYESPSLKKVYGYDPEQLVGSNILAEVHPEDHRAALGELAFLVENPGTVKTIQTRYRHANGTWRDIEVVGISLLHDPQVEGIVLTSHDVTERCRAERDLRALADSLEERVRQRTNELANSEARLRQSEKMEAIGRLAGGIAHDFNNQLAAILCCMDMLKMTRSEDARARSVLDAASTAAHRAADLTSQLLAFARKSSRLKEPVELKTIVGEVVALLEHSIDKRIEVREDLADGPHVVVGDPAQLHAALLNLALNARDAMPNGGRITFSSQLLTLDRGRCQALGLDLAAGQYIAVSVSDTGAGLSAEVQSRIFEPFFTTKPVGEGTGMGLAAVYGTARMHRGAVTANSAPGAGARFTLYLPSSRESVKAAHAPPPTRQAGDPSLRVLVVDDEDAVRETTAAALEALGHEVVACPNGNAAIDTYRQRARDFDVIVLDMMMPEMGGRETFDELRRIDPDVRVLIASGYSVNEESEAVLAAGGADFIQKPFLMTELSQRLIQLAHSRTSSTNGPPSSPLAAGASTQSGK